MKRTEPKIGGDIMQLVAGLLAMIKESGPVPNCDRRHWRPSKMTKPKRGYKVGTWPNDIIGPNPVRGGWQVGFRIETLRHCISIVNEMKQYWQLTLRQVYYRLVAAGHVGNKPTEYKKVGHVIAKARLQGLIKWEAIEDRNRPFHSGKSTGWDNAQQFISQQTRGVLVGYHRDIFQTQTEAVELWIEKDALSSLVKSVAEPYGVHVVVGKGNASLSCKHEAAERIRERSPGHWMDLTGDEKVSKHTTILYFADLDPSGWDMPRQVGETLFNEMGVPRKDVTIKRCALTPEQVMEYNLPQNQGAIKVNDSNKDSYQAMMIKAGHPPDMAVELDALPPDVFTDMVRSTIEDHVDLEAIAREQHQGEDDQVAIEDVCQVVVDAIENLDLDIG